MRYLPLVWAGLWRKRTRTIITFLSIVIAFLLFGLLQGVAASFDQVIERQHVNRLFVMSRISLIDPLPLAHQARIAGVPGVTGVSHMNFFGGYYQDPKNQVPSFAVDPETYFDLYPELKVSKEQVETMKRTPTGAIVARSIADKYGWKVGDKVPLRSIIFSTKNGSDWIFDIVGIQESEVATFQNAFFLNYDYFDEANSFGKGTVGWYVVRVADPERAPEVAAAIDALFANSRDETKTQSEKELTQSQLKRIGDISLITDAIVGAVFFTLIFLTWNTMMQSFRERVAELAVLKTLGFSDGGLLALVMAESIFLCVLAGAAGLFVAWGLSPVLGKATQGLLGVPSSVLIAGIEVSVLLALLSGVLPAWRAKQLVIVDALAEH